MTAIRRIAVLFAAASVFAGAAAPALAAPKAAPAPAPIVRVKVDIWRAGEDGMTNAFVDVVLKAFQASPGFEATSDNAEVKVQLDAIGGDPKGGHTAFNYKVEITAVGQPMTLVSGNCYEDTMEDCASFIVDKTYSVVKKPRPAQGQH